jgi:hypothetical protein
MKDMGFYDFAALAAPAESQAVGEGPRCSLCKGTGRMPGYIDVEQFLDPDSSTPSPAPSGLPQTGRDNQGERPACTCPNDGSYTHKGDCPEYLWKRKVGPQVYDAPAQSSTPPQDSPIQLLINALRDPRWQEESTDAARDIADRARNDVERYLQTPAQPSTTGSERE